MQRPQPGFPFQPSESSGRYSAACGEHGAGLRLCLCMGLGPEEIQSVVTFLDTSVPVQINSSGVLMADI